MKQAGRIAVLLIAFLFCITIFTSVPVSHRTPSSMHSSSQASGLSGNPVRDGPTNAIHQIKFSERGLPQIDYWTVTIDGNAQTASYIYPYQSPNTIVFNETPGVYNYTVSTYANFLTTYTPSPSSGTVTVGTGNISIIIIFSKEPLLPWMFNNSYVKYSLVQQSSTGIQYGSSTYRVTNVNESGGYFKADFMKEIGSYTFSEYNFTGFENGLFWNLPLPPLLIPQNTLLNQFNAGNTSLVDYMFAQFINPKSNVVITNLTFNNGVEVHTPIGSFSADEFSAQYKYTSGVLIPGASFSAYFDQHSGILLKYESSLNGNSTQEVQSTNIPMSTQGSRLILNVSQPDSEVSVNGIGANLTPGSNTMFLEPGKYFISASAPGYDPSSMEVNLTAGTSSYVNLSLNKSNVATYSISGYLEPGNASIVADQYVATVNSTGFYTINLPGGNYQLSATGYGYFPTSRSLSLNGNITNENFTLSKEPGPSTTVISGNVVVDGFNVTVSQVSAGSANISLKFSSSPNGIIVVEVPYSQFSSLPISEILQSRLYINGTAYTNFTVSVSAYGGSYNIVLTVKGLSKDPNMVWDMAPGNSPSTGYFGLSGTDIEIAGVLVVAVIAAIMAVSLYRRRSR